jgi:hypothetical protein
MCQLNGDERFISMKKSQSNERRIEDRVMIGEDSGRKPYQEPRVIDYGSIAALTKKPGSRGDGSPGTKGNKGFGS